MSDYTVSLGIPGKEDVTLTGEQWERGIKNLKKSIRGNSNGGEIEESKEYSKAVKACGQDMVDVMMSKSKEELENLIARQQAEMARVKEETQSLPAYVAAKETLKDLNGSMNEVLKPMKCAAALAVKLFQEQE